MADIDRATRGRVFRAAVQDALGAGIDGFTQVQAAGSAVHPFSRDLFPEPGCGSGMLSGSLQLVALTWQHHIQWVGKHSHEGCEHGCKVESVRSQLLSAAAAGRP